MPSGDNPFFGFSAQDLAEVHAAYKQCLLDIAIGGKAYTIAGRSFTRADLDEVKETLGQINAAIARASGTGRQFAQARDNGPATCFDPYC